MPGTNSADESLQILTDLNQDICAFIAEPIIGCGGQMPLPSNYLERVYQSVRRKNGVCISDEVQTGFGRLGRWFWGFEQHNLNSIM